MPFSLSSFYLQHLLPSLARCTYNISVYSLGNSPILRSNYPLLSPLLLSLLIYKELECNEIGRLKEKIARLVNRLHIQYIVQ